MFTALDHTLAYQRREETAHQVSSGRLENALRASRGRRPGGRWVFWLIRTLRAPANGPSEMVRTGNA